MFEQTHNLIIDIGNSNVKYHYLNQTCYSLADLTKIYQREALLVYIIAVEENKIDNLRKELEQSDLTIQRIISYNNQTQNPLKNTYPGLGADRISKASGALWLFQGKDLILMDFGTATTLTICTKEFKFLRGLIHLGFKSYLNAMRTQCPSLRPFINDDLLAFNDKYLDFGTSLLNAESSPQQAILEAAYREHSALISDDLNYAKKILDSDNYTTIATGGLAKIFADKFDHYIDSRILLESYVTNILSIPL
jgi:pantothenate kinase type III